MKVNNWSEWFKRWELSFIIIINLKSKVWWNFKLNYVIELTGHQLYRLKKLKSNVYLFIIIYLSKTLKFVTAARIQLHIENSLITLMPMFTKNNIRKKNAYFCLDLKWLFSQWDELFSCFLIYMLELFRSVIWKNKRITGWRR